ncbi:glycosyltransferase [Pedobacter sp. SAFR-022]|uniref:glycosyltransferase n=1 Tax=Pedobacter sp. SAFR-022 TaxID=3436861 RepID=UPI003F8204AC
MQADKRFSVLLSVYRQETPGNLKEALNSVIKQTLPPTEIVLVKDGPLPDALNRIIISYQLEYGDLFKLVDIPVNAGLGNALAVGLRHCTYELVARMDTDDIAVPERFEKQIQFLIENPHVGIVGSNIEEFNSIPGDLKRFKINPEHHEQLTRQIKLKSPFNHPSIIFRKQEVLNAGNYNGDLPLFEDYSLFLRLMANGTKFYNVQECLLYFRVKDGLETIKRRSGSHYLRKEFKFVNYAVRSGIFTRLDQVVYVCLKFPVRLMPPKVVLWIYNTFLRK